MWRVVVLEVWVCTDVSEEHAAGIFVDPSYCDPEGKDIIFLGNVYHVYQS
jgi:hypothetical protein